MMPLQTVSEEADQNWESFLGAIADLLESIAGYAHSKVDRWLVPE